MVIDQDRALTSMVHANKQVAIIFAPIALFVGNPPSIVILSVTFTLYSSKFTYVHKDAHIFAVCY